MMRFQKSKKGFTLTELAIVLGIVGTILGAIWVASSRVSANNKAQKAASQALMIANNYRSLYTQRMFTANEDVTCLGVNAGFFPSDMITSTSCTTGTTGSYPETPWGGATYVDVNTNTAGYIQIGFFGLTREACNMLANNLMAAEEVVFEAVNSSSGLTLAPLGTVTTRYTPSEISTKCNLATGNYIYIGILPR